MGASERRMQMIKVLYSRRYETMGNLAFEFGVSLRTVQRDIDEITTIIPIYIKTGRYGGGVYVMEQFNLGKLNLQDVEIEILNKVYIYFESNDQRYLNDEEKTLLKNMITKYSIPKK